MQVWLEHDSEWIYPDGPTGNLHNVYFNQFVPSFSLLLFSNCALKVGPDMKYCGVLVLNEPVFHVNYGRLFSSE